LRVERKSQTAGQVSGVLEIGCSDVQRARKIG
jgi:hypothetical protein